jgi:hypothetical protein
MGWVASKDQQLLQQVSGPSTLCDTQSLSMLGLVLYSSDTHHVVCDWQSQVISNAWGLPGLRLG